MEDEHGERFLGGLSFDVTDRYNASERAEALLRINEMGSRLPETEFLTAGLELAEKITHSKMGFLHFVNEDQETLELVAWTSAALKGCTAAFDSHYPVSEAGIWADCLRTKSPAIFNDYPTYAAKKGLPDGHVPLARLISVPIIEHGKVRLMLGVGNKDTHYDDFDTETLLLLGNDLWRIARRLRVEASLVQRVEDLVVANEKLSNVQLQLLQSEKMASIGQLASGVAHEINNPIGFIKSNLGSLVGYVENIVEIMRAYEAAELQLGEAAAAAFATVRTQKKALDYDFLIKDLAQLISESQEGVQRVSKIVMDLKNFSRSGDGAKEWCDLHEGIDSTINVVWNQLKYKVQLDRAFGTLPQVRCVASQISQVVMNLLVNAGQAIDAKGHITVRTGTEGDEVWFEVQDDGCGISTENQAKIFEPFYTSKPVGQGTGLGLSISFGIVQRHGGRITVQSAPGQGSTFRVTLPINGPEELSP
jgi:signal transduction histidine kinase